MIEVNEEQTRFHGKAPHTSRPRSDSDQPFRWITILAFVVMVGTALSAALIAITSFPITEGWYETLIFLQKHGFQPYKDVEFVLPPMTILYFRILDFLTHNNFAANKLVGVVIALLDAGLIFIWLRRLTSVTAAALAATLAFAIATSVPYYTAADYHDLDQCFMTITLILLLDSALYAPGRLTRRAVALLIAAGVAAQALFLTKQNVGLGLSGAYTLYIFARGIGRLAARQYATALHLLMQLAIFLVSFLAAGTALLRIADVHQGYFSFVRYLAGIQSKGSALYIATRLLHDTNNYSLIWPALMLATFGILLVLAGQYLVQTAKGEGYTVDLLAGGPLPRYAAIIARALLLLVPFFAFKATVDAIVSQDPIWLWNFWPGILAMTGYFTDVALTVWGSWNDQFRSPMGSCSSLNYARIVLFGAVIYANSLTAALSAVGLIVPFGFYAAFAIYYGFRYTARQHKSWTRLILVGFAVLFVTFTAKLEFSKFQSPYSWWGMQEPPVYASSISPRLPHMRGLLLDPDRVKMLSSVVRDIQANTAASEPILTYPDIPVFYYLANRLPMTHTYVQWFDFSTNRSLLSDFNAVANDPPKVVVQLSIPQAVYEGHESLLGRDVPQKHFSDYLQCMVENRAFKSVEHFFYNRTSAVDGTFRLRTDHALSAAELNQIATVARSFPSGNAVVDGALGLGDSDLSMQQIAMLPDQKSASFGGIVIKGAGEKMPALLRYLTDRTGLQFLPDADNFILRVLVRQGDWRREGNVCRTNLLTSLRSFGTNG